MDQPPSPPRRRRRRRRRRSPDLYVEVRLVPEPTAAPVADQDLHKGVPEEPEPELQADRILAEGDRLRLERRATQVAEQEAGLGARLGELDRREDELRRREAELADAQIRLERREQELSTYVTRLQAEFSKRN